MNLIDVSNFVFDVDVIITIIIYHIERMIYVCTTYSFPFSIVKTRVLSSYLKKNKNDIQDGLPRQKHSYGVFSFTLFSPALSKRPTSTTSPSVDGPVHIIR